MTDLEEELRRTFAERAAASPRPGPGVADRVVARGRARLRWWTGSAAVLTACAIIASALVLLHGRPVPTAGAARADLPLPPPQARASAEVSAGRTLAPSDGLPVDVVADGRLHRSDGRVLDVAGTSTLEQVQRTTGGYLLVESAPGAIGAIQVRRVTFVDETTGAKALMVEGATSVVVAADGSGRLAWINGSDMYFRAAVSDKASTRRTRAPDSGGPVGFVGAAVLLADRLGRRHDLWYPDKGDYEPTWADLSAVYGVRAAGSELVGLRSDDDGRVCLAVVDAGRLASGSDVCGVLGTPPDRGWVSPNGRWLVLVDARGALVFDLSAGWRQGARLDWPAASIGSHVAWLDADTIALQTTDRLLVLPLGAPADAAEYPLPADAVIVGR